METVTIGAEGSDHITLDVHGRRHPGSTDFWDANWLDGTTEVAAGAFRGRFDCLIRADELEQLHRQLVPLYETLSGEAVLANLEDWLHIRMTGDGRGHVEVRFRLRDEPGCGNSLEGRLDLDQSFLPALLRQLASVQEAFPVMCR